MSGQFSNFPQCPLKRVYWVIFDPSPSQWASNSVQSRYSRFSSQYERSTTLTLIKDV